MRTAFPLSWPFGYKRTEHRKDSAFKQTPGSAQSFLRSELTRIGAKNTIVSSNARVQRDGTMYADAMGMAADPGVAVYFNYKGKDVVLCCDTYERIWENVYAIGKTLENLRAIERYGVSDFLNRSFTGFMELPAPITTPFRRDWWEVLGVSRYANAYVIKEAYRDEIKKAHPDMGGSADKFNEVQQAYEEALKEVKP